jgi:hypothetical protein
MASWVLSCHNCGARFPHSGVADGKLEDFFFPAKPQFLAAEVECPNCKTTAVYKGIELTYQA